MQTGDCRPDTKFGLGTKCGLQNGCKMQTENLKSFFVWHLIICHLTTLPSVSQSLFRDQLSRLFTLFWNIPDPFLDENWSYDNFKPSYSLLTLHASMERWKVGWCYSRFSCRKIYKFVDGAPPTAALST